MSASELSRSDLLGSLTGFDPPDPPKASSTYSEMGAPLVSRTPPPGNPDHTDPGKLDYIDISKLSPEVITSSGLPALPDPELSPELNEAWMRTFGKPLRFIKYSTGQSDPKRQQGPAPELGSDKASAANQYETSLSYQEPTPESGTEMTRSPSQYETSLNWSGAYLLPTPGKRFVQVWGEWIVPKVEVPKDPEKVSGTEYQCSTWIGFDGQRRYGSSTLPQIGTLQTMNSKEMPPASAWVQWWQRDNDRSTPVPLEDFPVEVGDRISCVLTVLTRPNAVTEQSAATDQSAQSVLFNIVNQTKRTVMALKADPPSIDERSTTRVWIAGATVAWVMERPAILQKQTLQELADYKTTRFDGCVAAEATENAPLLEAQSLGLESPWFVRMSEIRKEPNRIAYISTPKSFNSGSFEVAYGS